MDQAATERGALLRPPFKLPKRSIPVLAAFARSLRRIASATSSDEDRRGALERSTQEYLDGEQAWPAADRQILVAAGLVIADLAEQGWQLHVRRDGVEACPSSQITSDVLAEKTRVRQQELLKRDEQLRHPAVRSFIRSMEHRRLHGKCLVSIFSLMRDGRELADSLRSARAELTGETIAPLDRVTAPYLQFVSTGQRCEHTGFLLHDIWRYFRHTWTNQYTSVPGRSMMFLVRDGAVDNHPVMGIAALSSPIVQIRERDEWIGWQPTSFLEHARMNPSAEIAR